MTRPAVGGGRRWTMAGFGLVLAGAVFAGPGCSTPSRMQQTQEGITGYLADRLNVASTDLLVTCPPESPLDPGSTLTCSVKVGDEAPQEVTFTVGDNDGVELTTAVIPTASVETFLAGELTTTAETAVTVSCGDKPLLIRAVEETFECDAERPSDGATFAITVTVKELDGTVTYSVVTTLPTPVEATDGEQGDAIDLGGDADGSTAPN